MNRSRYVAVPAEAIESKLSDMGFTRSSFSGEVTYVRTHARCEHTTVTVYTSLPLSGGDVRGCGEDAIRVVAFFRSPSGFKKCVSKPSRVYRTGTVEGVLERLHARAREAYAEANTFLNDPSSGCFVCSRTSRGRTVA